MLDQWEKGHHSSGFENLEQRSIRALSKMFNPKITVNRKNAALFECDFEDTALYPVQDIIAALLETDCFQRWTRLRECILGDADDEDIASEDCVWAPRYVVRFGNFGESHFDTRLIGHVEFLGGRPGALSEACGMGSMMKWGSLRCVLGKKPPYSKVHTDSLQATSCSGCS